MIRSACVSVFLFGAAALGFAQTPVATEPAPVAPAPAATAAPAPSTATEPAPVSPPATGTPVAAPAVPPTSALPDATPASLPATATITQEPPSPGRITGIETNRDMIAAEAPTEIVISGNAGSHCALTIDFGDGGSAVVALSETTRFPLRITHTYPKTSDPMIRVVGAPSAGAVPCLGAVEAAVHVSPAGSKIEYITLSTSCPEGWLLAGQINPDKSFSCSPVADASAPTNLIHCIDGMRYFARNGYIGCMHPAVGIPAPAMPVMAALVKGKPGSKTMGMGDSKGVGIGTSGQGKGKGKTATKDTAATKDTTAAKGAAAAKGARPAATADAKAATARPATKPKFRGPAKTATGGESPN